MALALVSVSASAVKAALLVAVVMVSPVVVDDFLRQCNV
jgi:hypothetical protein